MTKIPQKYCTLPQCKNCGIADVKLLNEQLVLTTITPWRWSWWIMAIAWQSLYRAIKINKMFALTITLSDFAISAWRNVSFLRPTHSRSMCLTTFYIPVSISTTKEDIHPSDIVVLYKICLFPKNVKVPLESATIRSIEPNLVTLCKHKLWTGPPFVSNLINSYKITIITILYKALHFLNNGLASV